MRGNERDPEVIVRRLLQSERHLSARARDEVLALGTGAVPALLRILDNEVLEGWAPVHAVRLLGEMRISAAIGPMLRALAETDPLDMLRDAVRVRQPQAGAAAARSTRGATSIPMRTPRAAVRSEYEPIVYEHAPTGTAGNAAGDCEERR